MSRIGKLPITLPQGVSAVVTGRQVTVKGPKGELSLTLPYRITAEIKDGQLIVSRQGEDKKTRSNHGAIRAELNNMVIGVVNHYKKDLEIRGTGYKAQVQGNKLIVTAGYIHPVEVIAPQGIQFTVTEDTKISVSGADKVVVGQIASNIRKIKKPEPYKGKGIRYQNEFIKLKAGKTAKA